MSHLWTQSTKRHRMSQIEIERFLGRVLTDANFRNMAENSIEKACYHKGFTLSSVEMSLMRNLDFAQLALLASTLDDSIKRT